MLLENNIKYNIEFIA